jgi:hypothetical protein
MEDQRRQANDPSTTAEILRGLSQIEDNELQEALVRNPNTPLDVLLQLGPRFASAFMENASLPLHLLDSPDLLQKLPAALIQEILHSPTPPDWIWDVALRGGHCRALASAPRTSSELLAKVYHKEIEAHSDKYTLRFLAEHPNTPEEILFRLSQSPQEYVRMGVAENPGTPHSVLRKLLEDPKVEVRNSVLANTAAVPELFEKVSKDKFTRMLRHLAENENPAVREWAKQYEDGKNPTKKTRTKIKEMTAPLAQATGAPTTKEESTTMSTEEKLALAKNPQTTYEALLPLASEDDPRIQDALVRHPNAFAPLLEKLLTSLAPERRLIVTNSSNCAESILDLLAQDQNKEVRVSLCEGSKIGAKQLEMLASDAIDEVRALVAGHEKTPIAILKKMVRDESSDVRRALAENPKTPPQTLQILAKDANDEVRELAEERLS